MKGARMKKLLILAACALVVSVCVGCEAFKLRKDYSKIQDVRTDKSPIARYFEDRFLDFWDIFGFKFHMGTGLLLHARATKFAQAGLGFVDGDKLGFKGRELGYWYEWRGEIGVSVFYINTATKDPIVGNKFLFDAARRAETEEVDDIDIFRDDDRDRWSVGVCFHALFFGLDIEIQLKELFDFFLGIFTLDMCKDDLKNRLRRVHATAAEPSGRAAYPVEALTSPPSLPRAGGGQY
jgi:hypothetical protein